MSVNPDEFAKLTDRVAELERQVAALPGTGEAGAPEPVLDAEKFWALQGLKARSGEDGGVLFTGSVRTPDGPVEWQQGAGAESLLEADWSLAADALAALGQPVRLTLLHEVLNGTHSVAELGALDDVGTSGQLYHHLRALVAAGWLRSAGRGRYEVPAPRVVPLLAVIAAAQR
jgi:hypothetical protein